MCAELMLEKNTVTGLLGVYIFKGLQHDIIKKNIKKRSLMDIVSAATALGHNYYETKECEDCE